MTTSDALLQRLLVALSARGERRIGQVIARSFPLAGFMVNASDEQFVEALEHLVFEVFASSPLASSLRSDESTASRPSLDGTEAVE